MNDGPFLEYPDGQRLVVGDECSIGRGGDNDLVFDVANMSRRHAEINRRSGFYRLVDLESKNGTFVNGRRLQLDAVILADGDELVFGGAVELVFRDPSATPMAPRIGRLHGIWVDPSSRAVWVDATRIEPPLSARQLDLLCLLADHEGDVVSRVTIVDTVWADVAADGVTDDAVSALVKRLRARLREGPLGIEYVEVVKGRGIRMTPPE